ncbi:MAG: hypothetical protein LBU38_02100 [Propionibacteriaceae bacterium]|nr:hypothetical protein [Propionibacteriaceae bacterium]
MSTRLIHQASELQEQVRVARMYYLEEQSKSDIAKTLGISRFKVARILAQAREDGVVSITIKDMAPINWELSRQLANHWNIKALVTDSERGTQAEVRKAVGRATAGVLVESLQQGEILGLAWGRTLTVMTEYLSKLPHISVVQLTGSVTSDLTESPVELVRKTSLNMGAEAFPIIAPLVLGDEQAVSALKCHPQVKVAFELFDDITTAVLAVGSWDPPVSQLLPAMAEEDREALIGLGVRAEVAGIFVNDEGDILGDEFSSKCLSISASQVQAIPRVIAAAGGTVKVDALRAVVRSGLVTEIVTEHTLAKAALELPPITPRGNPARKPMA